MQFNGFPLLGVAENSREPSKFKFKLMNPEVCDDLRNKAIGVEFSGMTRGLNQNSIEKPGESVEPILLISG